MARVLNENVILNVKKLINKITNYKEGSPEFNSCEKCALTTLRKSDTMYFLNRKDIKQAVWSMADKFMFHGFFKHAEYLKQCHDKYVDKNLSESDLTPRLNIVKFLLCMSTNPTTQFWEHPERFDFINRKEQEEHIDWEAYLNEGIERWSPIKDESFYENSESDDEPDASNITESSQNISNQRVAILEHKVVEYYDLKQSYSQLRSTIQSGWFNGEIVCMKPLSNWSDANNGILMQEHLQKKVYGFLTLDPLIVISEYKVMREVLWQMWGPHTSTVFQLSFDKFLPKSNVSIASVCTVTFEKLMQFFVSYVELLDDFKQFCRSIEDRSAPETYKSYGEAVRKIIRSIFQELVELEDEIRQQDTTMTLLKLGERLEVIFEPIFILKAIQSDITSHYMESSPLFSSLNLLNGLLMSLQFSRNKMEQDIRLTLYLESLKYYFNLVNAWLVKNDLFDYTQEFVILNKNPRKTVLCNNYEMNFTLQDDIDDYYKNDGVIRLICEDVLQIGRNIHLLRLLGKYDDFAKGSETIYQEFIRRSLEEISNFYGCEYKEQAPTTQNVQKVASFFEINNMGAWSDYVDNSDGFLSKAFDNAFNDIEQEAKADESLFEKISAISKGLLPLEGIPEKIFSQILKDNFKISGLMVKNLLIENYYLDKHFEFLNHIFIFWDDLIFPFHRRLFEKMYIINSNWGNSVWLTSHLQDIIMDSYPLFYEYCTVQTNDLWKQCRDSLEACSFLSIQYEIKWPINIIITEKHLVMYQEIFSVILKIKWALYAINHLFFTDLEPKKKRSKSLKPNPAVQKLKYLRFNLINLLNSVLHYMFGLVITKNRIQFELSFEKSNDLQSLIISHEDFISSTHQSIMEIRDKKQGEHGFNSILKCVKMLRVMWNSLECATEANLNNCYDIFKLSMEAINPIINPVYIFDY